MGQSWEQGKEQGMLHRDWILRSQAPRFDCGAGTVASSALWLGARLFTVPPSFPFDAVLFDLDGTLVATDRFWPDAARAGAVRAFSELGLDRALPSQADWMDLVGKPLGEGFDLLFADLSPAARSVVLARCVEVEHAMLAEGRAGYLPGVAEALGDLGKRGVRIGIASNCSQDYLIAMMEGLGLAEWVEEARCLESRGISDKADMIEDLLLTFGTRRAVFVGDRRGDRDAAWANGLPHVHLARGYAAAGEEVEAEGVIEGMDALLPRLERRAVWVQELVDRHGPSGGGRLGLTGGPGAGKTLLAEELASHGLLVAEGEELAEVACDVLLDLVVPEDVLRRRLEGRDLRSAGAEVREEVFARLEAHRTRPRSPGATPIEAANALGPLPGGPGGR